MTARQRAKARMNERLKRRLVRNLISFYVQSVTDQDRHDGLRWYADARAWAIQQANRFQTTPRIVMEVVAALSPNNKWHRNLKDAVTVLEAVERGIRPSRVKVCTYNRNKEKAFRIARGREVMRWTRSSQKTFSFTENIYDEESERVTVDGHAKNAADDCLRGLRDETKVAASEYKVYEAAYIEAAKFFGFRGYEFQAIIWVCWKRVHKIV